jgi:peptidoglycan/xylan/chitin deacetylase (PgdA/CDA1 family)
MKILNGGLRTLSLLVTAMAALLVGCHQAVTPAASPTKSVVAGVPTTLGTAAGKPFEVGNLALAGFHPSARQFVNGPKDMKRVALTFDAGADDTAVPLLLKTLAEHHVHCTFFLTGAFCSKFPVQCKAIADAGMELGNHSFHHPHFTQRTDAQIKTEILSAEDEIKKVCGRSPRPLFRYPFGDNDKRVRAKVTSLGYQAIYWTLDSLDSVGKPKDADFVAARILSKIKPGSITLMHVSRVESAKSLPRIFDYLDKQGIQIVPISELLLSSVNQRKPHILAQNRPSMRQ